MFSIGHISNQAHVDGMKLIDPALCMHMHALYQQQMHATTNIEKTY